MKRLSSRMSRALGIDRSGKVHPDLELFDESSDGEFEGPTRDSAPPLDQGKEHLRFFDETSTIDLHPDLDIGDIDPLVSPKAISLDPFNTPVIREENTTLHHGTSSDERGQIHPHEPSSHVSGSQDEQKRNLLNSSLRPEDHEADRLADMDFRMEVFEDVAEEDIDSTSTFVPFGIEHDDDAARTFTWSDDSDFSDGIIDDISNTEPERETADWEDLLDLDLYDQDVVEIGYPADEYSVQDWRLEQFAASLVGQIDGVSSQRRVAFKNRFRAILEEFPFDASYRAMASLLKRGVAIENLEDACELKCIWRESPWLWLARRFDRMRRAWVIESYPVNRNGLTWLLAIRLIEENGFSDAARKILEDWLDDWRNLTLQPMAGEWRIDPRFRYFTAFLQNIRDEPLFNGLELWRNEDPVDLATSRRLYLEDENGVVFWSFEQKDSFRDNGLPVQIAHRERRGKGMQD